MAASRKTPYDRQGTKKKRGGGLTVAKKSMARTGPKKKITKRKSVKATRR